MTYEEAINRIKPIAESSRDVDRIGMFEPKPITVALEMAIKALEKQVPKVACVIFHETMTMCEVARCPACNKRIFGGNFCEHCGQALYWSNKSERSDNDEISMRSMQT